MPRRPCLKCGELTASGSYCRAHRPWGDGSTRAWRALRAKVLLRDGGRCVVCGSSERLEAHHIVSKARGGPDVLANLETRCESCHDAAHAA